MSDEYPIPEMADVDLIGVLRALSDPTRLEIVRILADGDPHKKTPDVWGLGAQKSALAYHFKALREAGITATIVEGRNHSIQLRRAELDDRFPGLIEALVACTPIPPSHTEEQTSTLA